jgi:hypothetical protein
LAVLFLGLAVYSAGFTSMFKINRKTEEPIYEASTQDAPALPFYLGGLVCMGCYKRCVMLYPQCLIGEEQKAQATANYYEQYANKEVNPLPCLYPLDVISAFAAISIGTYMASNKKRAHRARFK